MLSQSLHIINSKTIIEISYNITKIQGIHTQLALILGMSSNQLQANVVPPNRRHFVKLFLSLKNATSDLGISIQWENYASFLQHSHTQPGDTNST